MEHEQKRLIPVPNNEIEPVNFILPEDAFINRLERYERIATRHAPKEVIVGEVLSAWEDYINLKLFAVIEWPVQTSEYTGTQRAECSIGATSLSELSILTTCIYAGRTIVANKDTKEIIAAYYFY